MAKIKDNKKIIEKLNDYDVIVGLKKITAQDLEQEDIGGKTDKISQLLRLYNDFISNLDGIKEYYELSSNILSSEYKKLNRYIDKIVDKHTVHTTPGDNKILGLSQSIFKKFDKAHNNISVLSQKDNIIPKTMLIYYDSIFESYMQKCLKFFYKNSPQVLSEFEIKLSYLDIEQYSDVSEIKDKIVLDKVSNLLWKSIDKQVIHLLKLLNIEDKKDEFPIKQLVDISNKRNILIHNAGEINDIYIAKCKEFSITNRYKKGEKLKINKEFFNEINDIYYEFIVKITFYLWIVFSDSESKFDEAINFFNNRVFSKINSDELKFALEIINFICNNKFFEKAEEVTKLYIIINRAIIFKMMGNKDEVQNIVGKIDWSAKDNLFKLARNVLLEDWKGAAKIMLKVVKRLKEDEELENGYISEAELSNWPLFFEFRGTNEFKKAYKKIFDKEFVLEF